MRFEDRTWTVAALIGGQARLIAENGEMATLLLSLLFADAGFEAVRAPAARRVAPLGWLESLPAPVRERALAWERHVREVETGHPGGSGAAGPPRAAYDPDARTLAQREEAKAAELSAAGRPTSAVTVRRMRARYRNDGVWGLVDQRAARPRSALGRADERVVAALLEVLEAGQERSSGTLGRLRVYTERLLAERHGDGAVPLPSTATFNRLAHALADGRGLLGSARQRRWRSARPAPPFVPTTVMAPGELVMMDSTLLDAFVVLDDGVVERPELTIALDVATRSICAAVLRPKGTRSVDAAQLLAQMMVPAPMRPTWPETLAMEHSVIPYERLLSADARLEGAAARPVITPQTIVVDQGKVFVSSSFVAACGSLGISLQPAPPGNGPAKGQVERTFSSINTLFTQHVAGYTGSHTGERGRDTEGEAVWTLAQLDDLLQEWIICGWQEREHDGLRHPLMPRLALSPNEMWAALVAVCGYVPVPLGREDYIELMPVKRQKINDYGIRIDYRTYDHKTLNPYRGEASPTADGLWEIHYNPHAPDEVWVRLPKPGRPRGYGWEVVPWIHRTLVSAPFTDFTWQHVRSTVAQRGSRVSHEHDLALALRELLERAASGHGTRRDKVVAARARAHAHAANADGAVWGILYGQQPQTTAEGPDDDDGFAHGEEAFPDDPEAEAEEADAAVERRPPELSGAEGLAVAGDKGGQARPARDSSVTVYDPVEESLRW
ncbi:Mu transposase C-terminal domain-containing protein [Streptomyces sp. ME02-8801-2C]|uniref:Mu transposase C-terminal domain-containing protein n=1 Tax=Streptomyces sp. ME02-8801-2C TaxID=3028680 RepID=UPI0029A65BB3|nr:Mu transposase C-terminal domain-containing protein [Streptomyces sp. ME02-8801-2C]MDX3458884.1 Mu transposase C-terminal domain-containing protein [Streptomyces sp. ME02-8801-2C]